MHCARCQSPIEPGADDLIRLAIIVGDDLDLGPVRWDHLGPWATLSLCRRCGHSIGDLLASPPIHLRATPAEVMDRPRELVNAYGPRPVRAYLPRDLRLPDGVE